MKTSLMFSRTSSVIVVLAVLTSVIAKPAQRLSDTADAFIDWNTLRTAADDTHLFQQVNFGSIVIAVTHCQSAFGRRWDFSSLIA